MQQTLTFLTSLQENNNREWFEANRSQYEQCRQEFEQFIKNLLPELIQLEPDFAPLEPKNCIFRIYRDVRFSKDKRPYKTHFGAFFAGGGRKSTKAGYYLHIEPDGKSMLTGGIYMPPTEDLKKIRQEIDYNGEKLRNILNGADFATYFDGLSGDKVKTMPKGYATDHPNIELLKMKDFTAVHMVPDKKVSNGNFMNYAITVWKAMKPLNDFLNGAVG